MSEERDDVAEALAEVARLGAEAAALAQAAETSSALTPATGAGMPAEQIKTAMVAARRQAAETARELKAAQQRARDAIEAQQRALNAHLAQASAALRPLQEQLARMQEGIWSINLYLGVGEEIVVLASGEPAQAGTPICVRQSVLFMDEESAVAAESGGIDHLGIDQFDGWITADPAHVEQLLPEQRGVVAIMPRRAEKDYGGGLGDVFHNEMNHQTYILIRNGDCLYRYIAGSFDAGTRLTPLRDEFTRLFVSREYNFAAREYETVALVPGTPGWERAERAAGARERHFMRVALILQGLIDRTAVFRPLPAQNLSLLHPQAYDDGHIVLISDDEMALATGRKPFRQWLRERNAQLRPGMRVVGNFRSRGWDDVNDCRDYNSRPRYGRHSRIWPPTASHPQTGELYTLERREGASLVFMYERTDEVWRADVPVPGQPGFVYTGRYPAKARQRASARISPADSFVIPLDLVSIEECEAYLRSRTERHDYIDMFPILKAVISAKRAEAEAEAPMLQLLTAHIAREHDVDFDEAAAAVPDLVHWWKLANRWHRPLVTGGADPKAEARAVVAISREFAARRAAGTDDDEPDTAERLRAYVPGVMLVARKRDGAWVVLEPQPRSIAGERDNVWVREHTWTRNLDAHRVRDWLLPEPSRTARWRILWSSPAWAGWDVAAAAADHLTDPEIRDLIDTALRGADRQAAVPHKPYRNAEPQAPLGGRAVAVHYQPSDEVTGRRFTVYWLCDRDPGNLEHGADGARLTVRWKRSTGSRIAVDLGELRPQRWTSQPWSQQGHLAWKDDAAVAALEESLQAHRAAEHSRQIAWQQAHGLRQAIGQQWSDAARASARRQFVADYGDESLWPDHSASMRFDCPHLGSRGMEKPWEKAVERLVGHGVDIAGLTVAEMAGVYATRFDSAVPVPEDIACCRFPADPASPSRDDA